MGAFELTFRVQWTVFLEVALGSQLPVKLLLICQFRKSHVY